MKIQVLVVGFNRSLSVTYPTIKRRILEPLGSAGEVHPTFILSRSRKKMFSEWSGEDGLAEWNPPQSVLFSPHVLVEQEDIDAKLATLFEHVEAWSTGRPSVDKTNAINLLRQLWLLDFAQQFIDPQADVLFYLRPDLLVRNRFPAKLLRELVNEPKGLGPTVWTPNWGFQPNDRMALMRPGAAAAYFGRIGAVQGFMEQSDHPLVGERVLEYAFAAGFLAPQLALKAQRIRSNGTVVKERFGELAYFDVPKRRGKWRKSLRRIRENYANFFGTRRDLER